MKKVLMGLLLAIPFLSFAQRDWSQAQITTTELAPGIHRLFVADAVAVVSMQGPDGLLVIDAAYAQTAEKLKTTIQGLSSAPIRYLVNTHLHADHTGGNQVLGKDADIIAHPSVREYLSKEQRRGDNIIPAFPEYALPNIFVEQEMTLVFNGEDIRISHLPNGHTQGDIIVYFPKAKVLVLGDLLFAGYFPYVDTGNGGNPIRYLENLEWVIASFPQDISIVGGHGPVYSVDELKAWHKDLEETFEVVRLAKANGMDLEAMKTQRILKNWEHMGKFFITEDLWLQTLYPYL